MNKTEAEIKDLKVTDLLQSGEFAVIFINPCIPPIFVFSEETLNTEVELLARETEQKVFILRPSEVREVELPPIKSKTFKKN